MVGKSDSVMKREAATRKMMKRKSCGRRDRETDRQIDRERQRLRKRQRQRDIQTDR